MSSKQYLSDVATRHAVFLQRYAKGQSKDAIKVLNRLRRTLIKRLEKEPTIFQRNRLNAVLNDINGLAKLGFNEIKQQATSSIEKLAVSEAKYSANLFNKATDGVEFAIPSDSALIANVMQANMSVGLNAGLTLNEALSSFSKEKSKQILQIVNDGVTLGDTTEQIARSLSNTINTLQRRQITTLASTMANHTSSISRKSVYDANDDILDGYQWLATLDNRTTLICGSRDGEKYPDETGFSPYPPAHWGCRSTTIPSIKPEYDVGKDLDGTRPAVGADGVESVSSRSTYSGWLKKQPKDFVDEALGTERSKLFRSGKLKLTKFVDPTGKAYTLRQLEKTNKLTVYGNNTVSKINKRTIKMPSGKMETFTVHKHGNIDILVQDGMNKDYVKQQITVPKMKEYINQVPIKHRGGLKEVRIMDEYFQDGGIINKNSVATFDIDTKHLEFYRNSKLSVDKIDDIIGGTVRHEIGHITESNLPDSFLKDWKKAIKADGAYISDYAKTDIYEDVAETLMNHWSPARNERRVVDMFFESRAEILKKYGIDAGVSPL